LLLSSNNNSANKSGPQESAVRHVGAAYYSGGVAAEEEPMSDVAEVTDTTFEQLVLKSTKPVMVDYWADWCSPCKQLSPIIDELAREHGDKVTFLKLDTNENTDVPTRYGVMGLPTLQIWSNGELVHSMTGGKTKAALIKALADFI